MSSLDARHSLETDNLHSRSVSSKYLVPLLPDKGIANTLECSIFGTHDCSCTSLIERIVIAKVTMSLTKKDNCGIQFLD